MSTRRHLLLLLACLLSLGATAPAARAQAAPPALAEGEVRKVDLQAGKLTIRHGDIKHLDMPGMTMVFTVSDARLLANLKVGDKIRFMAVDDKGKLIVTEIQPVR